MITSNSSKYLENVAPQNYFVLANGRVIENLEGLYTELRECDDSVFYHHVNNDRDDFANWIKYCIFYDSLYEKLVKVKQKNDYLEILSRELTLLKITQDIAPSNVQTSQSVQSTSMPVASIIATASVGAPTVTPNSNTGLNLTAATDLNSSANPDSKVNSQQIDTPEPIFEFEQILKNIMDDIDKEILSWEG